MLCEMVVSSSYSPGISSSSNLINASTSTGSPGLKGREQAIEVLIDSDPCGSFYRAARIVVSTSHVSRAPSMLSAPKSRSMQCNFESVIFIYSLISLL